MADNAPHLRSGKYINRLGTLFRALYYFFLGGGCGGLLYFVVFLLFVIKTIGMRKRRCNEAEAQ